MYIQDLIQRLTEMKILAANTQIKQKEKSKAYYDRTCHDLVLTIGDKVYQKKDVRRHKFDRYRKPALEVIEVHGKTVTLLTSEGHRLTKHIDKLTLAPQRDENFSTSDNYGTN